MRILVLSGGSGRRLWPLSNDIRAKQFLKVLSDEEGNLESMIQRIHRQLSAAGLSDKVTFVAGESQRDQILAQLGNAVDLVLEPSRRDTFPAITLGCAYLESVRNLSPGEAVLVIPVDPFVEAGYFEKLKEVALAVEKEGRMVLLGARPDRPTEQYGYITLDEGKGPLYRVKAFVEKPPRAKAEALIAEGALWNMGVFGFTIDLFKKAVNRSKLDFKQIFASYDSLEQTSFDYKVLEKEKHIAVLPYKGQWKDLGTWKTLTQNISTRPYGKVMAHENSTNTYIINELNIPLAVMGIRDAIVVATHEGILVSDLEATEALKDIIKSVNSRPMYEEKRWGSYIVLDDEPLPEGRWTITKKLFIDEGKGISYQYHLHREEIWTILKGEGLIMIEGMKSLVTSGDVIKISKEMKHGIQAITPLEIIEVQMGEIISEKDIIRIDD